MGFTRRSFLVLAAAAVPALVAACGATPTPTPQPAPQPVAAPYGPPGPANQGPRFSVDRREIDYGNVRFEQMVGAVFKVTNTGAAPLVLGVPKSVRAEEGC